MQRTDRHSVLGELGKADARAGAKHLHDRLAKRSFDPGPERFPY